MGYADEQADALASINEAGGAVTVKRKVLYDYDLPTDVETIGTPLEYPVYGVWLNYRAGEIDGSVILATDSKLLIAGSAIATINNKTDTIIDADSNEWEIVNVVTLDPDKAGAILHTLQVRK